MKRALLWLCVACCCSITAGASAEDMFSVLKETRKLVREGKYEEALERYEAAYENALLDPTNDRLSSSAIIRSWQDLGVKYPPAMNSLQAVRDRTIKTMLETGGSYHRMQDIKALNKAFNCESQTIDLFEQVVKNHPELASRFWIVVKDQALAAERYDLATTYMPDLDLEFVKLKTSHELVTAMMKRHPANLRMKKISDDDFVESVVQLITVGLKTGKPDVAAQVQKDALAVMDDPRIRGAIPKSVGDQSEQTQKSAPPESPDSQPATVE